MIKNEKNYIRFYICINSRVCLSSKRYFNVDAINARSVWINLGASNCESGCIYDAFNLDNDGSLNLLYKANVGGGNELSATFFDDYTTTFANSSNDPEDALIEHVSTGGNDFITCPDCYLAIKDGNHNPSYYFYDLSAWDGSEDINMQDFWPNQGAISHVSIWGRDSLIPPPTGAPEPTSLLLLAIGLIGLTLQRRLAK